MFCAGGTFLKFSDLYILMTNSIMVYYNNIGAICPYSSHLHRKWDWSNTFASTAVLITSVYGFGCVNISKLVSNPVSHSIG